MERVEQALTMENFISTKTEAISALHHVSFGGEFLLITRDPDRRLNMKSVLDQKSAVTIVMRLAQEYALNLVAVAEKMDVLVAEEAAEEATKKAEPEKTDKKGRRGSDKGFFGTKPMPGGTYTRMHLEREALENSKLEIIEKVKKISFDNKHEHFLFAIGDHDFIEIQASTCPVFAINLLSKLAMQLSTDISEKRSEETREKSQPGSVAADEIMGKIMDDFRKAQETKPNP